MASSKQTPSPASSLLRLSFPTCIIEIHILITIVFASSVKTISKLPRLMSQIKSFLPFCFFLQSNGLAMVSTKALL